MHGNGGHSLACRWSDLRWLGRRCQRARLKLERALRSRPAQIRVGLGAGALLTSSAVGAATSPGPSPSGGDSGPDEQRRRRGVGDFGHPRRRATDVLLALNAVVFLLNWATKDTLLWWGAKINALVAGGQVWRLVTALFLHPSPLHLGINMYALHTLGSQVELVSGTKRTAVIYMAAGVLATVTSFLLCPAPSVGASGAIFGLGAALAMFYWQHRNILGPASDTGLRSLGLTVAINIAYSMVNKKLDNWGHFGGAVSGALLAYLLGPRLVLAAGDKGTPTLQDRPPVPWLAFKTPAAAAGGGALPFRRRVAGGGVGSPAAMADGVDRVGDAEPHPASPSRGPVARYRRGAMESSQRSSGLVLGNGEGAVMGGGGEGGAAAPGPRGSGGDAEATPTAGSG